MHRNPLTLLMIPILREASEGLSEFQLIKTLEASGFEFPCSDGASTNLQLFEKHFLVMNGLYQLQDIFWEEGVSLQISPLTIRLHNVPPQTDQTYPSALRNQHLRDYYLDWRHYDNSNEKTVGQLLDSFWRQYFAPDQRLQALATLKLSTDSNWQDIRIAYRRFAAKHHPDKGGDAEKFCSIRAAYELLACSETRR